MNCPLLKDTTESALIEELQRMYKEQRKQRDLVEFQQDLINNKNEILYNHEHTNLINRETIDELLIENNYHKMDNERLSEEVKQLELYKKICIQDREEQDKDNWGV